jgi:multidrug efflux pump subunit AcrA (membrane-fusion protein)
MRAWIKPAVFVVVILVLTLGWMLYFHNTAVAGHVPKWAWLQSVITHLGQHTDPVAPEDENPDTTKNEIPVHTAHITTATLHRYVEGFGTIAPRPPRPGEMAGAANIASPVPGVVSKVLVQVGQKVHAGEALIQLDDRLAKSAEDQTAAALAQAQASLAALKAMPRPDQLQIAQLNIDKSQSALQFAQKNYDRLKQLAAEQGTTGKSVEVAALDVATTRNELAVAQKQLAILKATPTREELTQEHAKVTGAAAALVTARVQRQMLTIHSPIDATVVSLTVNPGESVDVTRTLVQLVALDWLFVDVGVPVDELPANAAGLPVEIVPSGTSTSGPADPIMGKIAFVSPEVDSHNGAVRVGIDLPPATDLRPGLTVRVRIIAQEHKDVLAVPRDAVVADENGDSVISLVEGDQATHKTVKAGIEENGLIEITADGLKEGQTVVTAGAYGLPQASRVKVLD